MSDLQTLSSQIQDTLKEKIVSLNIACSELTIEIEGKNLLEICQILRDDPLFRFEMLMDLCGVDYLHYGLSEWTTFSATKTGFSRGVDAISAAPECASRFAVIYHLLSVSHNHRLRVRAFAVGDPPIIPSVMSIWNSASWYEREAFDLFGILFAEHPDLRRILTDYGFIGHPFRKDFPLIGNMEMRYSAAEERVVYEPVNISPRTLVPKTIRNDNRYSGDKS